MQYMRGQVPSYLLIIQCDPNLQTFCLNVYLNEVVSKLPRFTLTLHEHYNVHCFF